MAGGVFTLIAVLLAWLWLPEKPERVRKPSPGMTLALSPVAAVPALTPDASSANKSKPFRLVYRNSVIPGGVHSAAELAAAMQGDAFVKAHYANFNVAAAQVVQAKQSRLVHVSYRIGNQIYWTKNKVRLALGEELLWDGMHLARAHCGNRIADEPEGPVLGNEPAPEVLDTVFVSTEDLIDQPAMAAVGTVGASSPAVAATTMRFEPDPPVTPPNLPPPVPPSPNPLPPLPPDPPPVPPTPTPDPMPLPEPGSTSLFGFALIALALIRCLLGRSKC